MFVTLSDIARHAGVSISTVSRVLNKKAGKCRISAKTEALVQKTAKQLGYRPNQLARGLRLKRTNTLGIIAPDISNPFFAHIIRRVQNVAHEFGYSVVVCNTDEAVSLEKEHVNFLRQKQIDGLIAMPVGVDFEHFATWPREDVPLVLVDRCRPDMDVSTVAVDNFGGAFEATDYLARHGHRRIALIQGLVGTHTNQERVNGFRSAMEANGIPVEEGLIVGSDYRQENGYVETKRLLESDTPPTALFATSDLIALGAMQAIYDAGLSIPGDVSLIMFDDLDFAPFLKCPLTAIRQPKEQMGETAVKILVELLDYRQEAARHVVLKPQLVERQSVARPSERAASARQGIHAAEV